MASPLTLPPHVAQLVRAECEARNRRPAALVTDLVLGRLDGRPTHTSEVLRAVRALGTANAATVSGYLGQTVSTTSAAGLLLALVRQGVLVQDLDGFRIDETSDVLAHGNTGP